MGGSISNTVSRRLAWPIAWLAAMVVAFAAPAESGRQVPRVVKWEELIPKDWDPGTTFRDRDLSGITDSDPRAAALLREMREIWDNAPTNKALEGQALRLPGYAIPLELSKGMVKEFLLVPYFGACIHTPPPPANQIVHVVLKAPRKLRMMEAVWAQGVLSTGAQDTEFGKSGYRMAEAEAEPYRADPRPPAKP